MREALEQARRGRLHILEKMQATLNAPRTNISTYAPRIVTIQIPVDKIRDVIGPGGKMIRSIIERTGVKIDVEDDGRVNVASADEDSAQRAIAIIQELTATPELNKSYLGKVQRITDFGAFVEIMPGVDGLLHVSEIAKHRVNDVRDELKEGEQLMVKVINIDPSGKVRLSRKALLEGADEPAPAGGEGGAAAQPRAARARRPPGRRSSRRARRRPRAAALDPAGGWRRAGSGWRLAADYRAGLLTRPFSFRPPSLRRPRGGGEVPCEGSPPWASGTAPTAPDGHAVTVTRRSSVRGRAPVPANGPASACCPGRGRCRRRRLRWRSEPRAPGRPAPGPGRRDR